MKKIIIKGMITALKLAILLVLAMVIVLGGILFNAEQMDRRYADMAQSCEVSRK